MDTIVTPVTVVTLDSTKITHSIKADLVARYFPPVVRLVQYDQSLPVIAVSLMQNGQAYTLPSGAAANIRVHKPDATYVYNPALGCDSTRNIVYFEVTQAMAAANGDGLAIVEIVVDGDIAGTSLITLHFEENPVPEDAIESSDEWETIYDLGERIIASTVTPVSTAAGMTDHNVVYLYTGTESGWNQGHMYYYNGTAWVDAGIAVTDTTLSVAGLAADAKATGDEIATVKDGLHADGKIENAIIDIIEQENTLVPLTWVDGFIDRTTGKDNYRDANQRAVGYIPIFGKNIGVRSLSGSVFAYLFEYDKDYNYITSNATLANEIFPTDASTVFVRIASYSNTVTPSEQGANIVAEWKNTNSPMKNNREDINVIRNELIDNGVTDEYIVIYDTDIKAIKIPYKNVFEVATLDGSAFTTNSVAMYASDGTTVLNTYGLSPYSGNKRTLTNNIGEGFYVKLANVPPVGIKITVFTKKQQPEKIRVMQYNIGGFNWGHSGGLSTDVDEKIANYKKFLGEYAPNICGMEEYTDYIDSASTYAPNSTLFDGLYFFNGEDTDVDIAVKSDYDKRHFTNFYTKNNAGTVTGGSFVEYFADVKNTELVVVSGAIAAGRDPDVRSEAFENLLKRYIDKTNVVMLIDTNVISEAEHTALVATAKNYSYSAANGGYFGSFNTYNLESSYYHKIDNILVKGNIKIKNVIVPDVYAQLSSDHYPIIADLEMLP